MNKRKVGEEYEELAVRYLLKQRYKIVARNFRCRIGEIDIIAKDDEYYVFTEVKYRKSRWGGGPELAVNYKKQVTITKVAQCFLMSRGLSMSTPCRFDVIAFTGEDISHIRNAFMSRR
ncbi:MAG: YraN family protein [Eubacterium sp.]|nr:YraN family protein [Eubacterium sp.]